MKRWLILVGSFTMILLTICLCQQIDQSTTVQASLLDTEAEFQLETDYVLDDTLEFQLLYQGYEIPYETDSGVYYLPQNSTEMSEWQGGFTLAENSQKLYWGEDPMWDDLETAFETSYAFTFYVVSGETYQVGKIIFTTLPIMTLNYTEDFIEEGINCRMDLFDPMGGSEGQYLITRSYAHYELRGKTSLSFPKNNYNLTLYQEDGEKNERELLGFERDDQWKLNALYGDSSKIREMISIQLWNEIAQTTDSRYDTGTSQKYMELLIDGEYRGLYGLLQKIDYEQLGLNKERDVLFKGVNFITGGNSSMDLSTGVSEYCGVEMKPGNREITEELWNSVTDYLDIIKTYYLSADTDAGSELLTFASERMNLENLLNIELFVQAIHAEDNAYKNQYIAAVEEDTGDYVYWKVPWDLNYSFGDCYCETEETLTIFKSETAEKVMKRFMLTETLLEGSNISSFAETLNETWSKLRSTIFSLEHLAELSVQYLEQLTSSGAFFRDSIKWHQGKNEASFKEALEYMEARLTYLDEHYTSYLK